MLSGIVSVREESPVKEALVAKEIPEVICAVCDGAKVTKKCKVDILVDSENVVHATE